MKLKTCCSISDRTHPLRKRIAQLETELRAVRKLAQAQRQRIAQKYGYEFLALIDSEVNCKVFAINIVQKLVFEDEEGNIVSETNSSFYYVDYIVIRRWLMR